MCNTIRINAKNENQPVPGLKVAAESKTTVGKNRYQKAKTLSRTSRVTCEGRSNSNNSEIHHLCFLSISLPNKAPIQPPTARFYAFPSFSAANTRRSTTRLE